MKVHVIVGEPPVSRRTLRLSGVPRVGDRLWMDTKPWPSMGRHVVRKVEWFERFNGENPGVVVTVTADG